MKFIPGTVSTTLCQISRILFSFSCYCTNEIIMSAQLSATLGQKGFWIINSLLHHKIYYYLSKDVQQIATNYGLNSQLKQGQWKHSFRQSGGLIPKFTNESVVHSSNTFYFQAAEPMDEVRSSILVQEVAISNVTYSIHDTFSSLTKSLQCPFPSFFIPTTPWLGEPWTRAVHRFAAPQQTLLVEEPAHPSMHTGTLVPASESYGRSTASPERLSQLPWAQCPFPSTSICTQNCTAGVSCSFKLNVRTWHAALATYRP